MVECDGGIQHSVIFFDRQLKALTESAAGGSIEEQLLSASRVEITVAKNDNVVITGKLL